MKDEIDEEDIMESPCYIILCYSKDERVFTDRVYRDSKLCQKRIDYLNAVSKDRGTWRAVYSELGK